MNVDRGDFCNEGRQQLEMVDVDGWLQRWLVVEVVGNDGCAMLIDRIAVNFYIYMNL